MGTIVICWILTHSSANPKKDYKDYKPYRCHVMKDDYNDNILVTCHDAFVKAKVNEELNSPEQFLKDSECLYEKR